MDEFDKVDLSLINEIGSEIFIYIISTLKEMTIIFIIILLKV